MPGDLSPGIAIKAALRSLPVILVLFALDKDRFQGEPCQGGEKVHRYNQAWKQFRGIDRPWQPHCDRRQEAGKADQRKTNVEYDLTFSFQPLIKQGIADSRQHPAKNAGGEDADDRDHLGKIAFIDLVINPGINDPGDPCQQA